MEFGDRFEREGEKVDLLVANAAVIWPDYHSTTDGWEEVYVHFSIFLLLAKPVQFASKPFVDGFALHTVTPSPAGVVEGINPSHCNSRQRHALLICFWSRIVVQPKHLRQNEREN